MKNKICIKCNEEKPLDDFSFKNKTKNIRSSCCKACHKKYAKQHYKKNKKTYVARARKSIKEYKARNRELIIEYLLKNPCIVCGEKDIIVLDFDHRNPKEKSHNVSMMINSGHSWETIQQEIEKCDVLCANCHRRKTAKQFNSFKYKSNN